MTATIIGLILFLGLIIFNLVVIFNPSNTDTASTSGINLIGVMIGIILLLNGFTILREKQFERKLKVQKEFHEQMILDGGYSSITKIEIINGDTVVTESITLPYKQFEN